MKHLFDFKSFFSTENKNPKFKKYNKFLIIVLLVAIGFAMIGVWGDLAEHYTYSYTSYTSRYYYVGIEFYIYSGWKYLADTGASPACYTILGLTCLLFVINLLITYLFGIKSFVEGISNVAYNEDCSIFGKFLIICISNIVYFAYGGILTSLIFVGDGNDYAGWGKTLVATFLILAAVTAVVYSVCLSFNKERIKQFVGKLFLIAGIFLCVAIIDCSEEGYFNGGISYCFNTAFECQRDNATFNLYIMQGILSILIVTFGFFILVQSAILVITNNSLEHPYFLIPISILLILSTIVLVSNGFAQELIDPTNVNINDNAINGFIMSVVLSTINLTNYILVKQTKKGTN